MLSHSAPRWLCLQNAGDPLNPLGSFSGLAHRALRGNHTASFMSKEWNDWKSTMLMLDDIQKACVEHGHSNLWNLMDYEGCHFHEYLGMLPSQLLGQR